MSQVNGNGSSTPIIRTEHLHRVYELGGEDVHAVNDVTLDIFPHQMTAIVGRSGSGKTTLLNLIAGLDDPTEGAVWIDGQRLHEMTLEQKIDLRRNQIGFVFQAFGLLPLLTAEENVGVPLRMRKLSRKERTERVQQALDWVGLNDRKRHRPYEMSGGEQQRVALARALAAHPRLILADEPTGQLDTQTGRRIIELLRRFVSEQDITVIIVTHDPQVMEEVDVVHELRDGRLLDTRYKI
ncbi:MAG: ABC transporter ATP-binding protein [Anaerolineae bacterium]|nr:ABC transporter ATP-binding protein [Anaerolineae bacterium]